MRGWKFNEVYINIYLFSTVLAAATTSFSTDYWLATATCTCKFEFAELPNCDYSIAIIAIPQHYISYVAISRTFYTVTKAI